MKTNKNKLKKSQKQKLKAMFLKVVAITFVICLGVAGAAAAAYKFLIFDDGGKTPTQKPKPISFFKPKDVNKTVAIFGLDKGGDRTDVILVVNYNSKTGKVKGVSIPRDTKVEWSEAKQQKLKEYKDMEITVSKINEMSHYGGMDHIKEFTIDEIQNMLGIKIDNYVIVSTDAFKKIVDAIGGVEVDVPALNGKGLQYDDSAQDLHIHLSPGLQTLNGSQAEGLVRYRKGNDGSSYAQGDVGRIETQQLFLTAFAKKLLAPSTLTKLPQIVPVIFSTVKTDMSLTEIPEYYSHLKKINLTNVKFQIIPGQAVHEDKWYFVADKAKMKSFVDEVFYDKVPEASETVVEDKTVTIEVLNATTIKGLAGSAKDKLEKEGYNVVSIDNYEQNDFLSTMIYAKDLAKANQFKKYYPNATIEQSSTIKYDIQILIGQDAQ